MFSIVEHPTALFLPPVVWTATSLADAKGGVCRDWRLLSVSYFLRRKRLDAVSESQPRLGINIQNPVGIGRQKIEQTTGSIRAMHSTGRETSDNFRGASTRSSILSYG